MGVIDIMGRPFIISALRGGETSPYSLGRFTLGLTCHAKNTVGSSVFSRASLDVYTGMRRIMTFRSTTDRIYDSGPIGL